MTNAHVAVNHKLEAFNRVWDAIEKIEGKVEWNNGTGYFDGAAKGENAPLLAAGKKVGAVSTNGRRLIIMGAAFGNIVVFQRYNDNDNVFTVHRPNEFKHLIQEGSLSSDDIRFILGYDGRAGSDALSAYRDIAIDVLKFALPEDKAKALFSIFDEFTRG